ncbi:hypothetical protein M0R88_01480 [Halorussus gelatinilyticus]|uniref:Uncharacterized protein n=1 Tax=Halorussus gelatinilyticus TaxID=2937524 RepID=A0A8U0IL80_9EURY|nr:hypothetical protein [Halorussus gelatinilyticus]UPW00789.1 hypothetical protein M0R88_01480 [Halorussus gelatinilyticus]
MGSDESGVARAGTTFAGVAAVISLAWATGTYAERARPGSLALYGQVVAFSLVISGPVGGGVWKLVVERSDRWSLPHRGAVAGGLTMWLTVAVVVPLVVISNNLQGAFTTGSAAFEAGALFVVGAILGAGLVGVFTIPVGVVVGYLLGRRQSGTLNSLPLVSRFAWPN